MQSAKIPKLPESILVELEPRNIYEFSSGMSKIEEGLKAVKSLQDAPYEKKYANKIMSTLEPFKHLKKVFAKKYNTYNINNAWLKMLEIYNYYPHIIPDKKVVSYFDNAAFPGSFIVATNHYISTIHPDKKLEWKASSLIDATTMNPGPLEDLYELYKRYPQNWTMSPSNNGDVTDVSNLTKVKKADLVDIYTSDIGFDVSEDFNNQERAHLMVDFGQIVWGINMLADGGSIVTKQFTYFHPSNISIIGILTVIFKEFYICKPQTSKMDNSETYFVGIGLDRKKALEVLPLLIDVLGRKLVDQPLLGLSSFSSNFKFVIEEFANILCSKTQEKIMFNIDVFNIVEQKFKKDLVLGDTRGAIIYIRNNIMKKYNDNIKVAWLKNNPLLRINSAYQLNMRDAYRQK